VHCPFCYSISHFNVIHNQYTLVGWNVHFIPNSDGELSTASCFKNPNNELMRLMFPESAFPTGVYREKEWNDFLSLCILDGLNDFLELEI
jgi:hypothetical protein